jgi:excisionase family DNA binding protein
MGLPPTRKRWLSTHEAAAVIGCHAQTVRDRCARGELSFTLDPASGHRRIDASDLEARGYDVSASRLRPSRRGQVDFRASLTAEVEGSLSESAAELIAEQLAAVLSERDETLTAASESLGQTRAALRELAGARFWQRRRVLARLKATPAVADVV